MCLSSFVFGLFCKATSANTRLRYLPRGLYDHPDGEAVVAILALQLIQDDRENGRCAYE